MFGASKPKFAQQLVQLILRSAGASPLIRSDEDWRELGVIALRTLFWRGGAIYACRADRHEMRFAVRVGHASLGSMAHHIAGAYAIHLRRKHGVNGAIFKHYSALACDEVYFDELVFWLHRPQEAPQDRIWMTEQAYLTPGILPWVSTDRLLAATYGQRKLETLSPEALKLFTCGTARRSHSTRPMLATFPWRPGVISIAHVVAEFCHVTYDDMLKPTRKRAVSKARVIATVLATRNGETAAAAARLFNRSRSSLTEQVEYYRANQPEIFDEAEAMLEAFLQREACE